MRNQPSYVAVPRLFQKAGNTSKPAIVSVILRSNALHSERQWSDISDTRVLDFLFPSMIGRTTNEAGIVTFATQLEASCVLGLSNKCGSNKSS